MHMKMLSFSLLLLSMISACLCGEDRPEVKTKYGTYRGHVIKSRSDRDILAFQGIPYAEPPVGELRFKEAKKLKERNGIFEANKESADCVQPATLEHVMDNSKPPPDASKFLGNEDCLYLNIYLPRLKKKELLPVYFWIHGGGFVAGAGSSAWNSPKYLLDETRDMVMVAINYRLGIFGFLSANDENLPGNLGLKDQTMALKWVKENIEAFGGDPNSITLGGLSAGGASVSHHINSKASKGLFHRAISQSGTANCGWALKSTEEARQIASKIISTLECPEKPKDLLKCLQDLPVDILMKATESLTVPKTGMMMYLLPVVEKDSPGAFMTMESMKEGTMVPWLTGITNEEGLTFYQFLGLSDPKYFDLSILKDKYKELFPILAYYETNSDTDQATEKLKNFYFGDQGFKTETTNKFVELLSDTMFNHGLHVAARKHVGKLYMYLLSYRGKNTIAMLRPNGLEDKVAHGDDMYYFFGMEASPSIPLAGKDLDLSNTLLEMWYNFIKNGDPTPDNQMWEESDNGKKYLEFTNDGPVMGSDLFKNRMEFLDKLDIHTVRSLHDEL